MMANGALERTGVASSVVDAPPLNAGVRRLNLDG
jgi:hypothetical protein